MASFTTADPCELALRDAVDRCLRDCRRAPHTRRRLSDSALVDNLLDGSGPRAIRSC